MHGSSCHQTLVYVLLLVAVGCHAALNSSTTSFNCSTLDPPHIGYYQPPQMCIKNETVVGSCFASYDGCIAGRPSCTRGLQQCVANKIDCLHDAVHNITDPECELWATRFTTILLFLEAGGEYQDSGLELSCQNAICEFEYPRLDFDACSAHTREGICTARKQNVGPNPDYPVVTLTIGGSKQLFATWLRQDMRFAKRIIARAVANVLKADVRDVFVLDAVAGSLVITFQVTNDAFTAAVILGLISAARANPGLLALYFAELSAQSGVPLADLTIENVSFSSAQPSQQPSSHPPTTNPPQPPDGGKEEEDLGEFLGIGMMIIIGVAVSILVCLLLIPITRHLMKNDSVSEKEEEERKRKQGLRRLSVVEASAQDPSPVDDWASGDDPDAGTNADARSPVVVINTSQNVVVEFNSDDEIPNAAPYPEEPKLQPGSPPMELSQERGQARASSPAPDDAARSTSPVSVTRDDLQRQKQVKGNDEPVSTPTADTHQRGLPADVEAVDEAPISREEQQRGVGEEEQTREVITSDKPEANIRKINEDAASDDDATHDRNTALSSGAKTAETPLTAAESNAEADKDNHKTAAAPPTTTAASSQEEEVKKATDEEDSDVLHEANTDDDKEQLHDTTVPLGGVPPTRCFRRCPKLDFAEAIEALLSLPQPPNRPDLDHLVPDDEDAETTIHYVRRLLPAVKAKPGTAALIEECGLSDDDVCALVAYKIETPYPVYKWLNGLLVSTRRDMDVVNGVGPFFTLLYRAMEKLPKVTMKAARSVMVRSIPALQDTYKHYTTRLDSGKDLNFWGFSSFSTDDKVINSKAFMGGSEDEAIVYTCPHLNGVDMELFKPPNAATEAEILPLPPAMFKVTVATMVGKKLTVVIEQQDNEADAYVVPSSKTNRKK